MPRPTSRPKVEHCRSLDVRNLARKGVLSRSAIAYVDWAWTNAAGDVTASLGMVGRPESLELNYSVGGGPCSQVIRLERTACHLGGERVWFLCPRCDQRCALLYLRRSRFACRGCQGLGYTTQAIDDVQRTWRKQAKLEHRLGPDWEKPKGMHWTTYDSIVDAINACEDQRSVSLLATLNRLGFTMDELVRG